MGWAWRWAQECAGGGHLGWAQDWVWVGHRGGHGGGCRVGTGVGMGWAQGWHRCEAGGWQDSYLGCPGQEGALEEGYLPTQTEGALRRPCLWGSDRGSRQSPPFQWNPRMTSLCHPWSSSFLPSDSRCSYSVRGGSCSTDGWQRDHCRRARRQHPSGGTCAAGPQEASGVVTGSDLEEHSPGEGGSLLCRRPGLSDPSLQGDSRNRPTVNN